MFRVLFLLLTISFLDLLIPEGSPQRWLPIILQSVLLVLVISYIPKVFKRFNSNELSFAWALLFFTFFLFLSALFSQNISRLPISLYAICSFFPAFYYSRKGLIDFKFIKQFTVLFLILCLYRTFFGLIYRADALDEFFLKADNVGYQSMYLMLLIALFMRNQTHLAFFILAFILVILSFKRGAILIGAWIFISQYYSVYVSDKNIKRKNVLYALLVSPILFAGLFLFINKYWDMILFRFLSDEGGSGRDEFWTLIWQGWLDGDIWVRIFGFGFYQVPTYLSETYGMALYAHSDWLELLYDHGFIGVIIYALIFWRGLVIALKPQLNGSRVKGYLVTLIGVWLLKSIFSGVYITKDSIFLFLVLGVSIGMSYRMTRGQLN